MKNFISERELSNIFHIEKTVLLILLLASMLSACTATKLQESTQTAPPNATETLIATREITPTATTPVSPIKPAVLGTYAVLTPEDMRFDLDELFNRLQTTHPNLYARRSKAEVDLERQRLYEELAQPMTILDYYKKVTPLVNSLGDYHTFVALPGDTLEEIGKSEVFFPFDVQIEGEHAYIIANYSGDAGIEFGTELLDVNGIPIAIILDESKRYTPSERYIHLPTFWYILGSPQEYQVTLLPPGETAPVTLTVPGLTSEEIRQQAPANQPPESVVYTTLPGEKIGVLTINNFDGLGQLLKSAFTQIQEDNVQHLIIDIRSNKGGKYEQVFSIMDYLTDQPYRQCSRSYGAPAGISGSGDPIEKECELKQPFNVLQRYQGKLYLLLGPDTISAAVTFATILQDYDLATLIGEETLMAASYCGDIVSNMPSLPHTHLLYRASRTCYVRPSGILDDRSVAPDIIVRTTINDQIAGNDPVLTYTLDMIRSSNQTP